jgi:putative hydrolase of the HAD superfamily
MDKFTAIIFDYGKVLSLPPTPEQWQWLSARFGKPLQEFQQIYWHHRSALDLGALSNPEYWKAVGCDCGVAISDQEAEALIDRDNEQWTNENSPMVEFSRELRRAGYKTAILSNMEHRMVAALRARLKWIDEFHVQMYSCEVGCIKPEEKIYLECCRRLGCRPSEALFLDDKQINTEGAKRAGLHSFIYHSAPDPVMQTGRPEIDIEGLRHMLLQGR